MNNECPHPRPFPSTPLMSPSIPVPVKIGWRSNVLSQAWLFHVLAVASTSRDPSHLPECLTMNHHKNPTKDEYFKILHHPVEHIQNMSGWISHISALPSSMPVPCTARTCASWIDRRFHRRTAASRPYPPAKGYTFCRSHPC